MTGLPILKQMTDNGDGTYTADYTVPSGGTFFVSVELFQTGGLNAEYFNNISWTGSPVVNKVDLTIDFDYSTFFKTQPTNISVRWSGLLFAPYSESYTFHMFGDDFMEVYIDDVLFANPTCCSTVTKTITLLANTKYKILVEFRDTWGTQAIFQWESAHISPLQAISSAYFLHS